MKQRIIIDTDIGDDIDDAYALAFALNSQELEIVGITTVHKNTLLRARMVKRILRVAGRLDIPVAAGISKPLCEEKECNEMPWHYLEEMNSETVEDTDAIELMYDILIDSNETTSIVTIGPLTNAAALLTKYPEIKGKIKSICLMGGAYYFHFNEYNIAMDPEAAKIVFESGVKIIAIGLDVTRMCELTAKDVDRLRNCNTPLARLLTALNDKWGGTSGYLPVLHDPLAIYAAFGSEYLELEPAKILVETKGEFTRGTTFNHIDDWHIGHKVEPNSIEPNSVKPNSIVPNSLVAKSVDSERFLKLFADRVFSPGHDSIISGEADSRP